MQHESQAGECRKIRSQGARRDIRSSVESIKANPPRDNRVLEEAPADSQRTRGVHENTRRVLNGRPNKKLGKWQL